MFGFKSATSGYEHVPHPGRRTDDPGPALPSTCLLHEVQKRSCEQPTCETVFPSHDPHDGVEFIEGLAGVESLIRKVLEERLDQSVPHIARSVSRFSGDPFGLGSNLLPYA